MSKFFLINGGTAFGFAKGELNAALQNVAAEILLGFGHEVRQVTIDKGYDIAQEVDNILWADVVIYQSPAWWMGIPWIMKKYIDEVFSAGQGKLYANDGRTRSDSSKKYGSGGLVQGKKYMLSVTWNAPEEAFTDPEQFFEGKGVDAVYLPLHKANQFLGMTSLPTYLGADVMKGSGIEEVLEHYCEHLKKLFGLK